VYAPITTAGGVTTLVAYEDSNNNGSYDAGTDTVKVFTLTENPTAGANGGQYTFTLNHVLDPTLTSEGINTSGTTGVGPHPDLVLNGLGGVGVTAGPLVDIYAFHYATSFDVGTWTGTGALTNDQINSSTQGLGVNSNNFQTGQLMHFDFGPVSNDPNLAGSALVHSIAITANQYKATDVVDYKVVYEDMNGNTVGSPAFGSVTGAVLTGAGFTFIAPTTGEYIKSIEIYDETGKGKIQLGQATTLSQVTDDTLTFSTNISDGDGDVASSGNFSVEINSAIGPVVLDLTGHGVHFVGEDAGVTFNYGQGEVQTAWAAPGSGVLALETANGPVVSFSGYVQGATTDLQGLAAFDTNHDGKLDAGDAQFSQFGVIVGGHLVSLTDVGIASINLTSNGQSYSAANGQVVVQGSGTFNYANGATGALADAAFTTGAKVTSAVNDALNQSGPDLNRVIDHYRGGQPANQNGQPATGGPNGQSYLNLHTGGSDSVNGGQHHHHEWVSHDLVSGTHHR
jgi:hypothetical protein